MPFADDGCLIAVALKDFGHILLAVVDMGADGGDLVDVVVSAGEDGGAAGLAERVGAEAVVEKHTALGYAVEIGGPVDARPVTTHGVGCVVVGHDEENIGTGHSGVPMNCCMRCISEW